MRRNPERLAWSVMLISFGLCVTLAIGVPLGIRSFLTNTTDPASLILDVPQGTTFLRRPNSIDTVAVIHQTTDLPEGSDILVDPSTQAALTMREPGTVTDLVTVQLSGVTNLSVVAARSPRFAASPNPHRLQLYITGGRVRVTVLDNNRPVAVSVRSPQGETFFSVGTYVVDVTNEELQVTVRDGTAAINAQGTSVVIGPSQRARVALGQPPQGGLPAERNLIGNGSFNNLNGSDWVVANDLQDKNEAPGIVSSAAVSGRRAAQFVREGPSHAETRLTQVIDRDVTESVSLKLHFAVLIGGQDVPVCGSLGSECPMMVRINYRDASGADREWLQGFYSLPDLTGVNPTFCVACATRNPHQQIPNLNTWLTYDSDNLMAVLAVNGEKPTRITQITFYASGHSYRAAVTDVELLVQD